MLSEEALIVLAAFCACGLLVLGVLELIWPTRPRHPVRVQRPAPAGRVLAARTARLPRTNLLERRPLEPRASAPGRRTSQPWPQEAPVSVVSVPPAPTPTAAEVAASPRVGSVVDECFALHQAGQHAEVLALATASLRGEVDGTTTAALWSVVALAQQGLGDDAEARTALRAAVAAAAPADRPTYQRQLGALAEGVARRLLAEAAQHPRGDSEASLAAVRGAVEWLEHAVAAAPTDPALAEQSAGALVKLWRAYERTATALLQRQDFFAGRRLLGEALADPRVPPERVDTFREMVTATFSGEIGQLTARAVRGVQDGRETDALRALERAEALLATLNDQVLSAKRREEVDRRLWWSYCKLGERRLAAAEPETALEPLVHALGYDVGAERHEETRALLERALDGAADREAAIVYCDRLWARLYGATETLLGDLTGASGPTQPLFETLDR